MTNEQIIIAGIQILVNLTILFFVLKSNTVVKERLKSQDDINSKMKSFMDIFSVDELRKFVDIRTENMRLNLENHIEKNKREFSKQAEPYIRDVLQKDLDKTVDHMQERYDELCESIYNLLITLPVDKRRQFIYKTHLII
ncbi:MAG: hypothetical protein FD181_3615 [Prolixibacteraceae bacterium]|nr:MAG: hypothetical protein FD181_3615 [Prolixibacteraceae bacterium]